MAQFIPTILEQDVDMTAQFIAFLAVQVKRIQFDFADNTLVQTTTLLPAELPPIPAGLELDAHLMVSDPVSYFTALTAHNFARVLVHAELGDALPGILSAAHENGLKIGLVFNPETLLEVGLPYKEQLDCIQLMGVSPGLGGQPLIESTFDRVAAARTMYGLLPLLVDGGVRLDNAPALLREGTNALVVGKRGYTNGQENLIPQWQQLIATQA